MQAVQAFVRQAMGYIDQTPDKETRIELIKTLQTVTEGKVRLPKSIRHPLFAMCNVQAVKHIDAYPGIAYLSL